MPKKKKEKVEKIDGLSMDDAKRIKNAVRQAWHWSHAWRLVKKRCTGSDGFAYCENKKCESFGKPVPKIFVDHIEPSGSPIAPGYIERMFVPSVKLQGLCKKCHDRKTREEKRQEALVAKDLLSS